MHRGAGRSAAPAQRTVEQGGPVASLWEGPLVISLGVRPCAMDSLGQVYVLVNYLGGDREEGGQG